MNTEHTPLTFQDMILTLQSYWAKQGCTIMQPYDSEAVSYTHLTLPTTPYV